MIDALMWGLTAVVFPGLLIVPALWYARDRRREAAFLILAMLAAGVLAVEIQFAVLRERPFGEPLRFGAYFPSFPSGHAAIAFAWATFVALVHPRRAPHALIAASLIGWSRVYLGHHYPSDVLLGAVLGAATAALAYGAAYRAEASLRPRWAWWLWPQLALVLFAGATAYLDLGHFAVLQLPHADKALHFLLYGLLAFFAIAWCSGKRSVAIATVIGAAGTLDEGLQLLSPLRSFDAMDLACTLAGIAAAWWLASRLLPLPHFSRVASS